jgi:hypothetical protein
MNIRAQRIDEAVAAAGELIGFLEERGPVTPAQARLVVLAVVRATVPHAEGWEIRESAVRIAAEEKFK